MGRVLRGQGGCSIYRKEDIEGNQRENVQTLCRGSTSQNRRGSKDSEAHTLRSPMLNAHIVFSCPGRSPSIRLRSLLLLARGVAHSMLHEVRGS